MNIFEESSSKPPRVTNYPMINFDDPSNKSMAQDIVPEEDNNISSIAMVSVHGNEQLIIGSFEISKFVVVQSLYEDVMGGEANHSKFQTGDKNKLPVVNVSFNEALEFCNRLSKKYNLEEVYSYDPVSKKWSMDKTKTGYRLPTVDEWQFAANGGAMESPYPYSGSSNVRKVAWYQGNYHGAPQAVGLKEANELGLYDMSGNVWEWCWYKDDSSYNFCCGGAYNSPDYDLYLFSSRWKKEVQAGSASNYIGFRLVRTQKEDNK